MKKIKGTLNVVYTSFIYVINKCDVMFTVPAILHSLENNSEYLK